MAHDGEVNRARCNPFNKEIVATKTVDGKVFIFDTGKQLERTADSICSPDLRLLGQSCRFVTVFVQRRVTRSHKRRLWAELEFVQRWMARKRIR